jgi:hypothetical protein
MTEVGAAATPASADNAPCGETLYKTGPWLVIFGHGIEAERLAYQVREQCQARGVHADLFAVDEVGDHIDLAYYIALIVILPSTLPAGRLPPSLRRFVEIIRVYRARRPDGLTSLLNGSRRWFQVGVVQVLGTTNVLRQPTLEPIIDRVCMIRRLDDGLPVDELNVFDIYDPQGQSTWRPQPGITNHLACSTTVLQAKVLSWGIPLDAVSKARQLIDSCRKNYNNTRFPALYRPINGQNLNRLDILLEEPELTAPGHKKWMENGARVTRDVMKKLSLEFPDLCRPDGRGKTKNAQLALRELYRALVNLENGLEIPPEGPHRS